MKRYRFAKIIVSPFPTSGDVVNPYIFGGIRTVVNVAEKESDEMKKLYRSNGMEYHHFPLNEESRDMGWNNIKNAVNLILEKIKTDHPVLIHCMGGNNRSRLVAECVYYCIFDSDYPDDYKGEFNHLIYNIKHNHLPVTLDKAHDELKDLLLDIDKNGCRD